MTRKWRPGGRKEEEEEMNGKKVYITPIADKIEFDYSEHVTASGGGASGSWDMGGGGASGSWGESGGGASGGW